MKFGSVAATIFMGLFALTEVLGATEDSMPIGLSFAEQLVAYAVGGVLGGALGGLLLPLTRWVPGGILVGAIAAVPYFLLHWWFSGAFGLGAALLSAMGIGGLVGGYASHTALEEPHRPHDPSEGPRT